MGAVQAQDFSGAKWALGMRVGTRASDRAIEEEFTSGRILRTHLLRPTWHFVTPLDIRWMLALSAPRIRTVLASYDRKLEIDRAVIKRSRNAFARALEGGKHLTRKELSDALTRQRISGATGQRLAHLVMHAELDAVIASGPRVGKQFTYALLDERAPITNATPVLPRDESIELLTTRYFTTRGPATVHDYAWWSGLTVSDAKRGIEMLGKTLEPTRINDRHAWFMPGSAALPKLAVHLLPNYDEYFIGFKDRSAIGERLGHSKLVEGGNALIAHVVVVNGELVGGWRRKELNGKVKVQLDYRVRPTPAEREAIERVIARHDSFCNV